ncbi:MAG: 2Fe-2S iron-sulfur cluster-binding protein [Sumerlaeia bacterium]
MKDPTFEDARPRPPQDDETANPLRSKASRRSFLKGMGLATGAAFLGGNAAADDSGPAKPKPREIPGLKQFAKGKTHRVTLTLNGQTRTLEVEPRTTLLDAVRENAGLTGCKQVCDRGACGACTMRVGGETVSACLTLAIDCEGERVTTIEGIAADPKYKALIDNFCEHDAAQCGYCIPGIVVRSAAMLDEKPTMTREEIQQGLAGNICRCGTYVKIFDALEATAGKGGVA